MPVNHSLTDLFRWAIRLRRWASSTRTWSSSVTRAVSRWAFGTPEPGKTPTGLGMGVRQRQTCFMRTLTVTVCQLDNRAQHRPEALRALRRHVVERGSELLVLPELPFADWLAADPVPDAARWQHSVEAHRAAVDRLQELGVRAVVASRPTVEVTGSRRNQAFIWTREGGAVRVRDKRYIPDEPGTGRRAGTTGAIRSSRPYWWRTPESASRCGTAGDESAESPVKAVGVSSDLTRRTPVRPASRGRRLTTALRWSPPRGARRDL